MTRKQKILMLKNNKCYSKFLKNIKDSERVDRNFDIDMSFNSFICFAFDWADTKEGHSYWLNISRL